MTGGRGARLHPGEELGLRARNARMTLGTASRRRDVPQFRRVPEQLLDHGGAGFAHRAFQEAYGPARAADPRLTPEAFLARLDPDSRLGGFVDALLGPASATLLRTGDRAEFDRALRAHYHDFRDHPPPYDAGVSYGGHRYIDGAHVDLRDSGLLVLPVNAPRFDRRSGRWLYPDYNDHARPRANRSVAAVQASRVWKRDVSLDRRGRLLFDELGIEHSLETFECYLDPELRMSRLQTAFTLSTGYSPVYRSAVVTPGGTFTGLRYSPVRNAEQARWELAARVGSHVLDPDANLTRIWSSLPKRGRGTRPKQSIAHDAFSQLSTDELFTVALRRPSAPEIRLNTMEWEHRRSQRLTRRLLDLADRLKLGPEWSSRFAMLTGICEPENLHFLPPWMHAREDFFAGGFAPDWRRVWADGEFKTEAFRANRSRMDRWGNTLMADFDAHPDLDRAKDVLVAYEPRHLVALLAELQHDQVQRAARRVRGRNRVAWNALIDQLNTAAAVYGITPALRLGTRK